ncbi:MAG: DUF1643 domain-containing protein [Phormidesmis sp. CAN_BIN36]|nr:DUF1643 domain-containing protein [Phormidesmis sp. CAN_BIN36]
MEKGADISADGLYRYALWRIWEPTKPLVMFIGSNLSTADPTTDDHTISNILTCMAFSRYLRDSRCDEDEPYQF